MSCMCVTLQDKLGDVVYAELPEVGLELEVEGMFTVISIYWVVLGDINIWIGIVLVLNSGQIIC